jgi:hypothetical protein
LIGFHSFEYGGCNFFLVKDGAGHACFLLRVKKLLNECGYLTL